MINKAVLVGRLTRDADLRYTNSGTPVASFTVAVDRNFTNQQGEREADFINCVVWGKSAENFANYTHKGSLVGIEGRIQTRSYENQQGNRVYVTEVVTENFSLLESKAESERYRAQHGGTAAPRQSGQSSSYNRNGNPYGAPADNGSYQRNSGNNGGYNNGNDGNVGNVGNGGSMPDPFADNGNKSGVSEDDLPF